MTSIKQVYCNNCKDYTPHTIFKSLAGQAYKCHRCNYEVIIDEYDNKTEGNDPVSIPSD